MSSIIDLTSENFDSDVVNAKGRVLVDFWAPWCGPCRMQTPILEKLSADESINVKIAKLNTDDNPSIAQKMGIVSIPTIILFNDGKEVERFVGVQPEDVLREKLK
jgi:thioredoxin 1